MHDARFHATPSRADDQRRRPTRASRKAARSDRQHFGPQQPSPAPLPDRYSLDPGLEHRLTTAARA
jgi:hypothetical protein